MRGQLASVLVGWCLVLTGVGRAGGLADAPRVGEGMHVASLADGLAALQRGAGDRVLLVEVTAQWCGPCQQLAREVLETPAWGALVGEDLALRVDFESDAGQALKRRFGVLALPTLLVVRADGGEVGRVEGYPGRREWVDAVGDVRAGRAGIPALEAALRDKPGDEGAALALAQARLVAGDLDALAALDGLIERGGAAAAHAARVKGRWLLRVREDAEPARAHFEVMARRFAGTPHRGHFLYWQAMALDQLKRRAEALALFEAWASEDGQRAAALASQADFMVHLAIPGAVAVATAYHAMGASAESHYTLSVALSQAGEVAEALRHARAAVALAPETALFTNHLRALGGP